MTVDEVKRRVEEIRELAADREAAHDLEDELRADVLRAIALGERDPQKLAGAALETEYIDFPRWCA